MKLQKDFYTREDVLQITRELLGKYLFTRINGVLTGGIITEAEAYEGVTDRASHAWNGRRTKRTEVMFSEGGVAYIYLCYGVHSLFNIVTSRKDVPHAILVRGIHPTYGLDTMLVRSGKETISKDSGIGPGKVSKLLGIHYSLTGTELTGEQIWLEDRGVHFDETEILVTKRIGVEYAGPDARLPYRFLVESGKFGT